MNNTKMRVARWGWMPMLASMGFLSVLPSRAQTPREVGSFPVPAASDSYGIAIGASGNISVANYGSDVVDYLSPTGTLISNFTVAAPYLANTLNGDLYLGLYASAEIGVYNPATGTLLSSFSSQTFPAGITFGNGDIYVSSESRQITTYNSSGTQLSTFSTLGYQDVALGPNGDLYQTGGNGNIYVYTTAGTLVSTLTIPATYTEGIRFDGNKILVTDVFGGNFFVLNTAGTVLGEYSGLDEPTGIAVAPNGRIYLSGGGGTVYIFSLNTVFGQTPGLTPNQRAIGRNIDGYNGSLVNGGFGTVVNALSTLPLSQLGSALAELSPQAFGQFTSKTAFNNASFETEAMDQYLDGQRRGPNGTFMGGNGGIDASGLTLNNPDYDPTLAMVHSRLLAWNAGPVDGSISDVSSLALGGVDMKDAKDMKSVSAPAYTNPWNFFIRGNVILAQGFSNEDVSHFDDNTESIVLGTDYRINPNFLVGLTAGYGHTDVTLDDNGSSATVDSYSPGLYASYADKGWYANLTGNYVHNAYTQERVIGFLDQTANSAPEGNQGAANLDGGYDFHHGALTYGPLTGVQYTHLTVDGYDESGSAADLSVADQESDSLRSRLGGRISYEYSHWGMTFTPHLDASWQHEFLDQSRGITSQFDGSGLGSFSVRTENPSRESALVDAGVDAQLDRTWTVFADYEAQAGQDNYFGQSVQAGAKIGF